MIPQRVTDPLVAWMRGTRLTPVVVIHVNHPAEIDQPVAIKDIVTQNQTAPIISDKIFPNNKCLGQPLGFRLRRIADVDPPLAPVF